MVSFDHLNVIAMVAIGSHAFLLWDLTAQRENLFQASLEFSSSAAGEACQTSH